MMTQEHATHLWAYTAWAHDRVLEAIAAAQAEVGDGDPLPRILLLMSHTIRAEEVWLGRVQATDAARLPIWPTDTLKGIRERARQSQATWRTYLASLPDAAMDQAVRYTNSKGTPFSSTLTEIITHVVNHGTHHRAQISALLRSMDRTPPPLDYIYFTRIPLS